jgi:hypothetical protein
MTLLYSTLLYSTLLYSTLELMVYVHPVLSSHPHTWILDERAPLITIYVLSKLQKIIKSKESKNKSEIVGKNPAKVSAAISKLHPVHLI